MNEGPVLISKGPFVVVLPKLLEHSTKNNSITYALPLAFECLSKPTTAVKMGIKS